MKVAKPITFHIPALFVSELDKCLKQHPPNFDYNISYFYFIVNWITTLHYTKDKKKEFTRVNTQNLQKLSIYRIGSYMKYLNKYEFIISDKNYIPGVKSKEYKLNEKYLSGVHYFEVLPETKLFKSIANNQRLKKSNYAKMPDYLKQMKDLFMSIDFDYEGARDWIEQNSTEKEKHFRRTMLLQLEDKRFRYFKRNRTNNRLDTNLTNVKKELRYFIKGDWTSFDLKNSQPLFLYSHILNTINTTQENTHPKPTNATPLTIGIAKRGFSVAVSFGIYTLQKILKIRKKVDFANFTNLSFELKKFKNAVLTGKYYESLMTENVTREEAKKINFGVFFSKNTEQTKYSYFIPYKKEKEAFARVYPYVYEVVKIVKEKDHTRLAVYLQKVESFVFIDTIAYRLVQEGIIPLTIHDSILVQAKHRERTKQIIEGTFQEFCGCVPSFHIESYQELRKSLNFKNHDKKVA